MSSAQWAVSCEDGVGLIRRCAGPNPRVLTMGLFNPWALLLEGEPPRGDWIAWDPGRNVSVSHHLDFGDLTRDATHILVPKFPYYSPASQLKLALYKADLERTFRVCGESDFWTLWERAAAPAVTSR